MLASVGYLMADVSADALVVEIAQREPLAIRGRTQTAAYTVRTAFMVVGNLLLAFLFNGKDYGGNYDFTLSFPQVMLILSCGAGIMLPITCLFVSEKRCQAPQLRSYMGEFWGLLQTRAIFQIIAYKFLSGFFENFTFVSLEPMQTYWAKVTPRNEKLGNVLVLLVMALTLAWTGRYGLHWNWRVVVVITTLTVVALDATCMLLATWDVVRNQYFWLGLPILEQFTQGVGFIVSTYVVVELAELGHEGSLYGLLTTVGNLSSPFAATISKTVNAPYDITNEKIQNDSTDVRWDVTTTLLIMYGMRVLSLEANEITKTPPDAEIAAMGALREGGSPELFTKQHIGLVLQYAAVGLVYGTLPSTIYPFMQVYLNASGAQVMTASTLVVLPWSFKVFYGALSDCFPLFGYRRRPYMVIGWTICVATLLAMGCSRVSQPYFLDASDRAISPNDYTPEIEARLNREASATSGMYVGLMMLAALGYVLADVCADGVVVELAQREPLMERGRTQSTIYATRTFAATLGQILTGVAFNGEEYGGSFAFSLTFPQLMMTLAVCTAPIIPISWIYIEESVKPSIRFSQYLNELWQAMQTRAVYQVVFYSFFSGIFANFSYTAGSPIQLYMVGVTPISSTISDIVGSAMFMGGIVLTGKYGLAWNWRTMTVLTGMLVIAVDAVCTFITVWDVFRSQWFWLGLPIAVNVPAGISFLIGTFVTVELVGEGHEGAMYGLLTTVANLSSPFAATLTKIVDSSWDLSNDRVKVDDYAAETRSTGVEVHRGL
ncbi:hypothetical protein BBP00_00009104 [Phytophthora kernoviae]|uniref:Uncharacterized protein n=2 Tax=Phytophthora kernoviae TaxID=325452 RepID=A0A3F2RDN8_9STRA|nr:hypothetical protein BBP00_00009104 [Phytophthora kernoviae]